VRIELLLNHRLRPCLLPRRLVFGLKLHLATLTDSNHRNVFDPFDNAKIALGHEPVFHNLVGVGRTPLSAAFDFDLVSYNDHPKPTPKSADKSVRPTHESPVVAQFEFPHLRMVSS
jgi:hypothetical protein